MLASGRRLHQHDVRALVVEPPFSPLASSSLKRRVPILTSGGLDFSLVIVPCSPSSSTLPNPVSEPASTEFETTLHRKAAYIPQRREVFVIGGKGLVVGRMDRSLKIWKVGVGAGWTKVGEMELKVNFSAFFFSNKPQQMELTGPPRYKRI